MREHLITQESKQTHNSEVFSDVVGHTLAISNNGSLIGLTFKAIAEVVKELTEKIGVPAIGLLGKISGGIAGGSIAIESLFDLYSTASNKNIRQRKTRYATSLAILAASAVVIPILIGAIVTAPIVLPLIFAGITTISLYREQYIISSLQKTIQQQNIDLQRLRQKTNIESHILKHDIAIKKNAIAANEVSLKYTTYRRNTKILSYISIGLLILSVVIPPAAPILAAVGLGIFVVSSLMQTVFGYQEKSALKKLASQKQNLITRNERVELTRPRIQDRLKINTNKIKQDHEHVIHSSDRSVAAPAEKLGNVRQRRGSIGLFGNGNYIKLDSFGTSTTPTSSLTP